MEKETTRLEAFSDGVFAVAITLLVLGLVEPHLSTNATNLELFHELTTLWPSYLAFILSFVTILIMWLNHHNLFKLVEKVSNRFMLANGFLLFVITFITFPTKIISQQLLTPSATTASIFFMGSYLLLSVAYNYVWYEAKQLLRTNIPNSLTKKITHNYRLGFSLYSITFILSFIYYPLSLTVFVGISIFWIVTLNNYQFNK